MAMVVMVVTYFVHASSSANLANAKVLLQYSIIRIYDEFFLWFNPNSLLFWCAFYCITHFQLANASKKKTNTRTHSAKSACNELARTQAVRTRAFGSILNPPVLAFILWVEYISTNSDSHSHISNGCRYEN